MNNIINNKNICFKSLHVYTNNSHPGKLWNTYGLQDDVSTIVSVDSSSNLPNAKFFNGFNIDLEDFYGALHKHTPDMSKVKNIYRFPNLALSRDKMSLVKDKYNVKITRDKDKADLWVISEKHMNKLFNTQWSASLMTKEIAISFLTEFKGTVVDSTMSEDLCEELELLPDDMLIDFKYSRWTISNKHKDAVDSALDSAVHIYQIKYANEDTLEVYNDLVQNQNKLVLDVTMNNITSEDSMPLDYKSYKQVDDMLISNSKDDILVAMNLMTNCNIDKSRPWLSLLFFDRHAILRAYPLWTSVGFKSLKMSFEKFINTERYYGDRVVHNATNTNKLTRLLVECGYLIPEIQEIVKTRMHKNVNDYLGTYGSNECRFTVDQEDINLTLVSEANAEKGVTSDALV